MAKKMKFERKAARAARRMPPPGMGASDFGSLPSQEIPHESVTDSASPDLTSIMAKGGEDVVRGNSNSQPLSPEGQHTAQETALKLAAKGGVDQIIPSTAERAQETAQAIQGADPKAPPITPEPGLESHALGRLEGEAKTPRVRKMLGHLVRKSPHARIPGQGALSSRPGESTDEFRQRGLSAVRGIMQNLADNPHQRIAVPTHSQLIKLVKAWVAKGHPDDLSISPDAMLHDSGEKPGDVERFAPGPDGKWALSKFDLDSAPDLPAGSIYFVRHGETPSTVNQHATASQKDLALFVKYIRSGDYGRARAVAKSALQKGTLQEAEMEKALDEALPSGQDAGRLPTHHLLAATSAASPGKRAELLPLLQQRMGDLSQLPPDAQRALGDHLSQISQAG